MDPIHLSFIHRFEPGASFNSPLLLLHGTGANEDDLLPLGRELSPGAARLSPRGQVDEHGMPRFFRRLSEGVFDEADLRRRVDDLAQFVGEARAAYGIAAPIAVGFSNGANMAAAMLLQRPEALAGAVLFRAMTPFRQMPVAALRATPVLILSGSNDPIVRADDAAGLAAALTRSGAAVKHEIVLGGHGLTRKDVMLARAWLDHIETKAAA